MSQTVAHEHIYDPRRRKRVCTICGELERTVTTPLISQDGPQGVQEPQVTQVGSQEPVVSTEPQSAQVGAQEPVVSTEPQGTQGPVGPQVQAKGWRWWPFGSR